VKRGTEFKVRVKDGEGREYWRIDVHQLLVLASMNGHAHAMPNCWRDPAGFVVEVVEGEEVRERAGFVIDQEEG